MSTANFFHLYNRYFLIFAILFLGACDKKTEPNKFQQDIAFQKAVNTPLSESPIVKHIDSLLPPHTETIADYENGELPAPKKFFTLFPVEKIERTQGDAGGYTYMQNFNTEQGLALSTVSCGFMDNIGNLWFGTYGGGVSRYDGKLLLEGKVGFTNFTTSNGLVGNLVKSIGQDRAGNMWFGTNGNGVSVYDGHAFTNYTIEDGLLSNFVVSIITDRFGNVWLASDNGISKFEPGGEKNPGKLFVNYTTADGLLHNRVSSIVSDRSGNIWIATKEGLNKCDLQSQTRSKVDFKSYTVADGLSSNLITSLFVDNKGIVWVGTEESICSYNPSTEKITDYKKTKNYSGWGIHAINEDKYGNIWFATSKAVVKLQQSSKDSLPSLSFTEFTTEQGLANNTVYCITRDRIGNLWFGSSGGGLSKYDGNSVISFTGKEGLVNEKVWSIKEDKLGRLLLATGQGISIYNPFPQTKSKAEIINYKFERSNIRCLILDKQDNIWFGNNLGAIRFDGKVYTNYDTKQGLPLDFVLSMMEDRAGNIWMGTYGGGVSKYNGNVVELEKKGWSSSETHDLKKSQMNYHASFTNYSVKHGLAGNTIKCILEDKAGNVWFGTNSNGVSKFNPGINGSTPSFTNYSLAQGLPHKTVLSLMEDRSGTIWIGTGGGGVCCYSPSKKDSTLSIKYTSADGLANDVIYGIVEDTTRNMIWFGTNLGLSGLKLNSLKDTSKRIQFENFNVNTGYPIKDVNAGAFYMDRKGILWAGTSDKLVRFDYNSVRKDTIVPKVIIQALKIHDQTVVWHALENREQFSKADSLAILNEEITSFKRSLTEEQREAMHVKFKDIKFDSISKFYSVPQNLVIPYEHNNITFDFLAIETDRPFMVNYQYMLEGYDKEWSAITNRTTATFGNIQSGSYTFKLKAQSPDGIWTEPLTYTFRILPPWYRTWWMYLIYITILIVCVSLYTRWRERKLKQENILLENKVQLRTRQLEEKNKIVEEQKKEVLEKNTKITDSINYAKRIQNAILPSDEFVKATLPESFILFKPKDIVSGDFYWLAEKQNSLTPHSSKIIIAVADCTGHGVPGAFMSMIGHTLLNEIVNVKNITEPDQILNLMNKGIVSLLHQNTDDAGTQDDGMDISIITMDKVKNEIEFAAANHVGYLFCNNQLISLKGDVYSIGGMFGNMDIEFINRKYAIAPGSTVYLYTDGFVDQFGGEKNSKFLTSRFEQLLKEIQNESMEQQYLKLEATFNAWKDAKNQTDDVLVLGIRF